MVVTLDSLERASSILPVLEGSAQDAFKEFCASLEDGAPAGGPPKVDQDVIEAPYSETTVSPPLHHNS